jgi:hypothetical protein
MTEHLVSEVSVMRLHPLGIVLGLLVLISITGCSSVQESEQVYFQQVSCDTAGSFQSGTASIPLSIAYGDRTVGSMGSHIEVPFRHLAILDERECLAASQTCLTVSLPPASDPGQPLLQDARIAL